jgi:hypothetical protein
MPVYKVILLVIGILALFSTASVLIDKNEGSIACHYGTTAAIDMSRPEFITCDNGLTYLLERNDSQLKP